MRRLLFVCSGNVCRSPLAELLFRRLLAERGIEWITTESSGTLGLAGAPIAPHNLTLLTEAGVDAASHRSRPLQFHQLFRADLIIVMEPLHRDQLEEEAGGDPEITQRILTLTEFHPDPDQRNGAGIYDFVACDLEVYREMTAEFEVRLEALLEYCLQLWGGESAAQPNGGSDED